MLELEFTDFPLLLTDRLRLREIEPGDATAFFELRKNRTFKTYLDRDEPKDIAEIALLIETIIKQFEEGDAVCWVLSPRGNNKFMGTISFWRIDKAHYRAEIGYGIHPDYQQQGYMSEAMTAVLDYGFKTMNLHSIEANVNPLNQASKRLLEKNNFVQEAYFTENYFYNGKFLDSAIYCLVNK